MAKRKVTELVEEALSPYFEEEGYELYHLEFVKEAKDWFLRVFIEKTRSEPGGLPGNVSTADCEAVSRFLSGRLDELDPIEQNYYLEVSSPGMDRLLLKEEHYDRYRGKQVVAKLYQALDGKKIIKGKLIGLADGNIIIEEEGGQQRLCPIEKVSGTRLEITL